MPSWPSSPGICARKLVGVLGLEVRHLNLHPQQGKVQMIHAGPDPWHQRMHCLSHLCLKLFVLENSPEAFSPEKLSKSVARPPRAAVQIPEPSKSSRSFACAGSASMTFICKIELLGLHPWLSKKHLRYSLEDLAAEVEEPGPSRCE